VVFALSESYVVYIGSSSHTFRNTPSVPSLRSISPRPFLKVGNTLPTYAA